MRYYQKKVNIIENGKEVRKTVYGKTRKELAKKLIALEEAQNKVYTFAYLAEMWEDSHFQTISYGTQVCYTPSLKRAISALGDRKITDITAKDINAVLITLKNQRFSKKTIATQKTVFNLIFNFAIVNDMAKYNPATAVTLPRNLPQKKRELPDDKDITKVIESVNEPFGLFAFLLLYTGLRRGEALALNWEDIDFEKRTITVNKSIFFEHNRAVLRNHTKTQAGMRTVILVDPLSEELIKRKSKGSIFNIQSETSYRHKWYAYKKATGINFTPHQLRHNYATILYYSGIDAKAAQTLLGHSDISVTQNIYTHIRQNEMQNVSDKLNSYLQK